MREPAWFSIFEGLSAVFFFAQASLHSRAASFQQVPDMLQISNRNWTSQTEWRSDIIMWQNPCFRSTVLLRRLNLNLGLQRSAVWARVSFFGKGNWLKLWWKFLTGNWLKLWWKIFKNYFIFCLVQKGRKWIPFYSFINSMIDPRGEFTLMLCVQLTCLLSIISRHQ